MISITTIQSHTTYQATKDKQVFDIEFIEYDGNEEVKITKSGDNTTLSSKDPMFSFILKHVMDFRNAVFRNLSSISI